MAWHRTGGSHDLNKMMDGYLRRSASASFNSSPLDKMAANLADDIFKCTFSWMKMMNLDSNFTEIYSYESNWQ